MADVLDAARGEVASGVEAGRLLSKYTKPSKGVGVEPRTEADIAKEAEEPTKKVPAVEALMVHKHGFLQKTISTFREKRALLDVLESSDQHARARVLSAGTTGAGGFLTCIPTRADLQMGRADMLTAVRFRLGLPQPSALPVCGKTCACGMRLTEAHIDGNHLINCKHAGGAGWGKRSLFVQLKTKDIAIAAGLTASLEQVVGSERDRTDVTIADYIMRDKDGVAQTHTDGNFKRKELHTDVAVVNATAPSYVATSAKLRGHAALTRAKRKTNKYEHQVAPSWFIPAIVEAHGLLGYGFVKLLSNIAECHIDLSRPGIDLSKTDRSVIKSQLMKTSYELISVALQKGVAKNIQIAAARATVKHAQRAEPGCRPSAPQRGLTACATQYMLGRNDRALHFGSQIVA